MTILFIDDDEDDRKLLFEATKEFDSEIICIGSTDATQAFMYLNNPSQILPDYIFLDLRMPGISGEQFLTEIKKDPRLFSIPVIVYTTSRNVKESVRLKKLGAAHFMSKPVLPGEVYYMVSFVLGEKWS